LGNTCLFLHHTIQYIRTCSEYFNGSYKKSTFREYLKWLAKTKFIQNAINILSAGSYSEEDPKVNESNIIFGFLEVDIY